LRSRDDGCVSQKLIASDWVIATTMEQNAPYLPLGMLTGKINMAQKILVVEDMESVVETMRALLEQEGFQVVVARNGLEGLQAVNKERPDLLLLDLILPGLDGLEVCRRLRRNPETAQLPILMLSGKAEEADKVVGLEVGADDYITKPFSPKELIARVKSHLRRFQSASPSNLLRAGGIEMDLDRFTVTIRGDPVSLTAKEFQLLKALLEAEGRVASREFLFETVWGHDRRTEVDSRTIDVHIRSLRNKLSPEGRRIHTVRNVGYRLGTVPDE